MTAVEWGTIANLATALGTLILAVATFSSVRSSNLMARVAQQQLLIELRPVLSASRREDPTQKVNFGDKKWVQVPGGGAVGENAPGDGAAGPGTPVVYLAMGLRNAGNGIAVLRGWRFFPETHRDPGHAPLEEFQRQNRDLFIPVGDTGFWQGAFRDPAAPGYQEAPVRQERVAGTKQVGIGRAVVEHGLRRRGRVSVLGVPEERSTRCRRSRWQSGRECAGGVDV